MPPKVGFQWVSKLQAPFAKRHVFSIAFVAPIVRRPSSQGITLWKALLSGSSRTETFQPASVLRTIWSFAKPGTGTVLPSACFTSSNCATARKSAGYGPPTMGSRRGGPLAVEAAGAAPVGAVASLEPRLHPESASATISTTTPPAARRPLPRMAT